MENSFKLAEKKYKGGKFDSEVIDFQEEDKYNRIEEIEISEFKAFRLKSKSGFLVIPNALSHQGNK
jgi:hypothetical protein